MNDQIMITTKEDAPDFENATSSINTAEVEFVEKEEEKEITETLEVAGKDSNKEAVLKSINKTSATSRAAKGTYAVKSHRDVKQAQARKYFGGKKKKKKRRSISKKAGKGCYNF